ncbi:MAG: DUF1467 family protein [Alphaproteobacteria bacterium]|nr:DUF1467 family protein [Alphaproteobacteria bacterium]
MLAFFLYLIIWWVTLFMVLPMGVQRHNEGGKGFDAGAPEKPDLVRKLLLNTLLSAIVLAVIYVLVETGVIRWHEWFDGGVAP